MSPVSKAPLPVELTPAGQCNGATDRNDLRGPLSNSSNRQWRPQQQHGRNGSHALWASVLDQRSKTFHSFRHTFKRACRKAGLAEEIHHALTGHSGGGVGRAYGRERRADGSLDRGISLSRLQDEINKVAYPGLDVARS